MRAMSRVMKRFANTDADSRGLLDAAWQQSDTTCGSRRG